MAEHPDNIVTCRTEECPNEGQPIRMPSGQEMDGQWYPMGAYQCGVCGQPITDVVVVGDIERPDNELPEPTVP